MFKCIVYKKKLKLFLAHIQTNRCKILSSAIFSTYTNNRCKIFFLVLFLAHIQTIDAKYYLVKQENCDRDKICYLYFLIILILM